MLQLIRRFPNAHLLACAPSNSAADLLAARLLAHLDRTQLLRFYAPSRSPNLAPAAVLACARRGPDGAFVVPTVAQVVEVRVVVTTCVGAAFAHNIGMPAGHFDYIFVDEAGQGRCVHSHGIARL
jgi:helicase MOV-10